MQVWHQIPNTVLSFKRRGKSYPYLVEKLRLTEVAHQSAEITFRGSALTTTWWLLSFFYLDTPHHCGLAETVEKLPSGLKLRARQDQANHLDSRYGEGPSAADTALVSRSWVPPVTITAIHSN
jgi:hypothetical protein